MAAIAGLYGGGGFANQEDGSGGRNSFFRGFRTAGKGDGDKSKDQRGAGGIDLQGAIKTNTYLTDE